MSTPPPQSPIYIAITLALLGILHGPLISLSSLSTSGSHECNTAGIVVRHDSPKPKKKKTKLKKKHANKKHTNKKHHQKKPSYTPKRPHHTPRIPNA